MSVQSLLGTQTFTSTFTQSSSFECECTQQNVSSRIKNIFEHAAIFFELSKMHQSW